VPTQGGRPLCESGVREIDLARAVSARNSRPNWDSRGRHQKALWVSSEIKHLRRRSTLDASDVSHFEDSERRFWKALANFAALK
jgi:hypothetical protein